MTILCAWSDRGWLQMACADDIDSLSALSAFRDIDAIMRPRVDGYSDMDAWERESLYLGTASVPEEPK